MATSAAASSPAPGRSSTKPPRVGAPWWGEGRAPHVRWPGAFIEIPARWNARVRWPCCEYDPTIDPSTGAVRHQRHSGRWEVDGSYYFDQCGANKACDFFPTFLTHHIGEYAGQSFTLLDWQRCTTRAIFGWVRQSDGLRRFRKVFVLAPKGNGKALALDTPIPTPNGWAAMGDLAVGSIVFGADGRPCRVIAATSPMPDRPAFRVEFSDGDAIVADAAHVWRTHALRLFKSRFTPAVGPVTLRTTEEIAATLRPNVSRSKHPQAKWNHRVEIAGSLALPEAALPIPPYTFGAWLGDGDSDSARLTVAACDGEIVRRIEAEGVATTRQKDHLPGVWRVGLGAGPAGRTYSLLRAMGVLKNKRIPMAYLRASVEQRLGLAMGILDTDGSALKNGSVEVTTVRAALAEDILELLRSLGYKPWRSISDAKLYGRVVGQRHRICLTPSSSRRLFGLERKQERLRTDPETRRLGAGRMITGCSPVGPTTTRCITVDSPDGMFLAGRHFVPTHNSPWCSGTGIYLTLCDGEEGAEVYALASDKLQARVVHKTAKVMVEQSADLMELCEVLADSIYSARSKSFFQVLSAEAKTKAGVRPHGIIMDELQEQPNRDLLEQLEQSMGKRRQPLIILLAHAGDDDEGIAYEEYTFAKGVISGTIPEETYLPVVFEAGPKDDWRAPKTWKKANPAYGITVKPDDMERQCRAAEQEPRKKSAFLRYRINRWTNDAIAWIPVEDWDACDAPPSYESGLLTAAGLDMAQKIDLAAVAVAVRHPRPDDKALELEVSGAGAEEPGAGAGEPPREAPPQRISISFAMSLFVHFWIPEDTMRKREDADRVPYKLWAERGLVTPTPGVLIDEDRILRDIRDTLVPKFALKARRCGYDPAFVSTSLLNGLAGAGLQMVETKQNYQMMNVPCQALVGLIKAKWLRHGTATLSHPLRWCAENVAIRQDDAGRIRPVKPKSHRKRIDGIVAGVMALDQLLREPGPVSDLYNERAKSSGPMLRTITVRR